MVFSFSDWDQSCDETGYIHFMPSGNGYRWNVLFVLRSLSSFFLSFFYLLDASSKNGANSFELAILLICIHVNYENNKVTSSMTVEYCHELYVKERICKIL